MNTHMLQIDRCTSIYIHIFTKSIPPPLPKSTLYPKNKLPLKIWIFSITFAPFESPDIYFLFQHSMLYFFHHYELPVILQQAQIRDILIRNNGQMPINVTLNNNNNNNVNTNNNNVMNNNMNGVRRLLRPRMRGFTLGGFRFRFGIVFHALQHPVQVLWCRIYTFYYSNKTELL